MATENNKKGKNSNRKKVNSTKKNVASNKNNHAIGYTARRLLTLMTRSTHVRKRADPTPGADASL